METCAAHDCTEILATGYDVCEQHLVERALIVCQRMTLQLREVELAPQGSYDAEAAIRTHLLTSMTRGY